MSRAHYNFFLLLPALVLLCILLTLDTSSTLHTFEGLETQAEVWREGSQLRVFIALQLLFLMLFCWALSYLSLWFRARYAAWAWIAASSMQALYFILDPRSEEGDLSLLLFGLLLFLSGALLAYLLLTRSIEKPRALLLKTFFALLGFFPALFLARFLTQGAEPFDFSLGVKALVPLYLYFAGQLAVLAFFVRLSPREQQEASAEPHVRSLYPRVSLLVASLLYTLICVGLIAKADVDKSYYGLLAPVVPPIMTAYAPYSWFQAQNTEVFSSILEDKNESGLEVSRAKIYLGIFFQYVTLCTLVLLYRELRAHSTLKLLAAHVALLCYFLPSFWLAQVSAALL